MTMLQEYLREQGLTQAQFAAEVGMTQGAVSRLCRRASGISLRRAVEIERATNGGVPASSWADPTPEVAETSGAAP